MGQPYAPSFDLSRTDVQERLLSEADRGVLACIHFGLPCRTWGPAGRLAGGTRRAEQPWGDGSLERERAANDEWRFAVRLICTSARRGGHFTLENPASSYVFKTDLFT